MGNQGDQNLANWGPLAALAGVWEGDKGDDTAPSDDRGTEKNLYRERVVFQPIDPVQNHEQLLFGLRYSTTAIRIGEEKPFHEENGYWLWDPAAKQVMRCFNVPRGVSLMAGGQAEPGDRSFQLIAEAGAEDFGILSNPFLVREFKTVRYELKVEVRNDGTLFYEEDTQLKMPGKPGVFHHIDRNTLRKVGG